MYMCMYMCMCVCVCVCVCVCAMHRVDVFQFLFVDKESLQIEALQNMAVKILTTNYSLVNGTSNMTQM